jgi:hypothetical protein
MANATGRLLPDSLEDLFVNTKLVGALTVWNGKAKCFYGLFFVRQTFIPEARIPARRTGQFQFAHKMLLKDYNEYSESNLADIR